MQNRCCHVRTEDTVNAGKEVNGMGDVREIMTALILELRRGTIVLSVLSQLGRPQYGYTLVKLLEEKKTMVDTNTLYPLLRRLEKQGILTSEWETEGNKPRKYYKRTELGDQIYKSLQDQWNEMSRSLNLLLEESEEKKDGTK